MEHYQRISKLNDFDLNKRKHKDVDILGIKINRFYKRVENLQRECFVKEKEEKIRNEMKKAEENRMKMDVSSFWKIKQMTNKFFNESNSHRKENDFINKSRIHIDNTNRGIEGNRVKSYLQKVALKNVAPKARIDNKRDYSYDEVKELILKSKNNYLNKTKRKYIRVSVAITPTKENNEKNDHMNESQILFENKLKHKKHSRSLYHNFMSSAASSFNLNSTSLSGHGKSLKEVIMNKTNIMKGNQSNNSVSFLDKNDISSIHSFQMKPIGHSHSSCEFHVKPKVINKPAITTKIEDIVKDYKNMKNQIRKERNRFLKRQLLSKEDIKKLMNVREEMRMIKIKEKFMKTKFPKRKEKPPKSFSDFVSEIGDLLDVAENKYYLRKKNAYENFNFDLFLKEVALLKK